MSHTSTVSNWIATLQWEDLPPEVVHQAKRCLKDFIGCTVGGTQSKPGQISTSLALEWGGSTESTVIGAGQKVAARHAAFANATMANALDFDDTLQGHHGATTLPTALAAGEKWEASTKNFLIAIIAGYELSVRAMALLEPLIPRFRSMWDLGTLQAFGSCATAARLGGLSADEINNALGLITGTSIVPLPRKKRYPGEGRTMLKSAYGWSCDAAIVAVQMTLAGFIGPGHALDDNMGFWKVVRSERLGLESFSDKLGSCWSILSVEFKPYMACRFLHPVLQGVEEMMAKNDIRPGSVEKIDVRSFSLLGDEHHFILQPASGTDAQFSLPYTLAAMLYSRGISPGTYDEATIHNKEIRSLAERVNFSVAPEFDASFPNRLGASVQISTNDGQQLESTVQNAKGSPDQPLSDDELDTKFQSLVVPVLGQEKADEISLMVDQLEELPSLAPLTRLLC